MCGASRVRVAAVLQGSEQVNGIGDNAIDVDMCDTAHDRMCKLRVEVDE